MRVRREEGRGGRSVARMMAFLVSSAAVVFAGSASGAAAQVTERSGSSAWLAWVGCWEERGAPASEPLTCVVPADDGATLLTVTAAGVVERQALRADGAEHPVAVEGCVGAESAEPSRDGTRLYLRSRLACEGEAERTTRGLMAMVSPDEWVRIRAMTVGDGSVAWVTRYRAAPAPRLAAVDLPELEALRSELGGAIEAARMAAAAPIGVDDIIEAHARTEPEAVRAWIAERGQRIALDAERLIRLAEAGVSQEVIDVAIAVSHPDRFAVGRRPQAGVEAYDGWNRGRYGSRHALWADPFYYDPFYRYGRYGYNSYGYGPGGGYYGYGSPTVIVVRSSDEPDSNGRAINGSGYTSRRGSGATARPRGSSGSAASSGSPSSSRARPRPASSSGGTSSSSRARPASSSGGSKGKAKPRGGG